MKLNAARYRGFWSALTLTAVGVFGVSMLTQHRQAELSADEAEMGRPLTALFERALRAESDADASASTSPAFWAGVPSGGPVTGFQNNLLDLAWRSIRPS